jgi:hypothetical protein
MSRPLHCHKSGREEFDLFGVHLCRMLPATATDGVLSLFEEHRRRGRTSHSEIWPVAWVGGCFSATRRKLISMIVFYRNGVPTVITGWRAWLIMLGAALVLVVIGGLVLGLALTVWTVMLLALPVMVIFGFVATWLQSRR